METLIWQLPGFFLLMIFLYLHCSPRAWWRFAIDANLHLVQERNKRCTIEYMTKRCQDNCLYVDAYIDYVAIGTAYMEERLKVSFLFGRKGKCLSECTYAHPSPCTYT